MQLISHLALNLKGPNKHAAPHQCSKWNGKPQILAMGFLNASTVIVMDTSYAGYKVSADKLTAAKGVQLGGPSFTMQNDVIPKSGINGGFVVFLGEAQTVLISSESNSKFILLDIFGNKTVALHTFSLNNDDQLSTATFISSDRPTKLYILKGSNVHHGNISIDFNGVKQELSYALQTLFSLSFNFG